MSENLMVYDEEGRPLYLKERSKVHKDGDLHYGVQCWIVDSSQNVILQLRHPLKEGSPNKWDVSCGGHCIDGEDPLTTLQREAKEELGISLNPKYLTYLSSFRYVSQEGKNQEKLFIFLYQADMNVEDLSFQETEVSSLIKVPLTKLKTLFQERNAMLANRYEAFRCLLSFLETHS